ncbi:MAG: GtrA family protein [Massilia sp.]|jgi:putative flippase GtrA|nr:GtrA family protein [Massilia sp.]
MRSLLAHRRQVLLFLAGGVLSAVVDIGLMQALVALGYHYAGATTCGFAAGLVVNYLYHAKVTFDSATSGASLGRYACLVVLNYLLTLGCVALAATTFDLPLAGKLISLPLVAINSFLLGKFWIFK